MSFRMIILVVALIAGGIAAYLALSIEPETQVVTEAAPPIPTSEVLVAIADVPIGSRLQQVDLAWENWPEENVSEGYIQRSMQPNAIADLEGSIARSRVFAGDPIRPNKLAKPGSGFLSAVLDKGYRAVAVRVSAETTAGGFVLPNDRVDVLHTVMETDAAGNRDASTALLLDNVRVLAVDQTIEEQDGQRVVIGQTATLQLTPEDAETIIASERTGQLSLALRSLADADESVAETKKLRRKGVIQFVTSGKSRYVPTR